jgi:lipoprotein-anchoring transpeptidase ErfK/SrfK
MAAARRVGFVGCSAFASFGVIGAVSTSPFEVSPEASDLVDDRANDLSRSGEREIDGDGGSDARSGGATDPTDQPTVEPTTATDEKPEPKSALPADSGSGKRVVFDITDQQVWLVDADGDVARTYMVSGSRYDQLPTGTFDVYSKSRDTVSWHGTETMEYMVRFFQGERAAIGFHDLPVDTSTGDEVQALRQLGTPLSDGCIRQAEDDAKALWKFTEVGTTVVVVRT